MKLDATDNAILDALCQNGRMSNREVARLINVSEGTVRQRLKKLESSRAMRLGLVMDTTSAGLATNVHIRIKAEPARTRAIAQSIASMEICSFVGLSLGYFDIVGLFSAPSRQDMIEAIDTQLTGLPGVVLIDVRETVKAIKHRYDLVFLG